jgi:uncharacterized protein (TIGR00369 family)
VVRSQDVTESICAFWESIPFSRHLGIRVEEMAEGRSRLRLSVRPELCNLASSSVHGGVLSSLVDAAAGAALLSMAQGHADYAGQTTVELNVSYLAAAPGRGDLVAEGHLLRLGRTLAVAEAEVRTDEGELVVKGRGTFKVWRS